MAKKPTITTVATGYNATDTVNDNFTNIRNAFDNTLSLDGSTPNAMEADLDLNGNNILNAGTIYVDNIVYGDEPLPILNGGTGASTASGARTNLGLGTMATQTASDYLTTSTASSTYLTQSNASSTYLTQSNAASTYQPLDSDLTALGGLSKTDGNFIVGDGTTWVAESGATARTSLGLGTMATETASNYLTTSSAASTYLTQTNAASTYQPLDSDLTAISGLSNADNNFIVGNGTTWVAESGATARTSLGLGTMATETASNYLTTATAASTYQPLDSDLTAIAALAGTSGFLKTNGAGTWTVDTNTYLTDKIVWRGNYSAATSYVVDDVVYYQGSSWICILATTGNAPPSLPTTYNTYWQAIAVGQQVQVSVFNLVDYIDSTNMAYAYAGNTTSQNETTVTASIQAFHDTVMAWWSAGDNRTAVVRYPAATLAINDELFSETFATNLWNMGSSNNNCRIFFESDNCRFQTKNWASRSAVRTSGRYAASSITYAVPKVIFRWEQSATRGISPNFIGGRLFIQGSTSISTDPVGMFLISNNVCTNQNVSINNLLNHGIIIVNQYNSVFDNLEINNVGYQPTEFGGTGFIPTTTTFSNTGSTITASANTFNASHVGKKFAIAQAGPTQGTIRTDYYATVSSVTSATQAVLATTPTINVTGKTATFESVNASTTAGSATVTLSASITDSLVGRYAVLIGCGLNGGNAQNRILISVVTAHTGSSITLAQAAAITTSNIPISFGTGMLIGTPADAYGTARTDDVSFRNLKIESYGYSDASLNAVISDASSVDFDTGSKFHGIGSNGFNNFGGNFSVMAMSYAFNIVNVDNTFAFGGNSTKFGKFIFTGDYTQADIRGYVTGYPDGTDTAIIYSSMTASPAVGNVNLNLMLYSGNVASQTFFRLSGSATTGPFISGNSSKVALLSGGSPYYLPVNLNGTTTITTTDATTYGLTVDTPTGVVVKGISTLGVNGLTINASGDATSERASVKLGDWIIGQDKNNDGTKNLFFYGGTTPTVKLDIGTDGTTSAYGAFEAKSTSTFNNAATFSSATGPTNSVNFSVNGWPHTGRIGRNGTSGADLYLGMNWNPNTNTVDSASYGTSAIQLNAGTNGLINFMTGAQNTVPSERMRIHPAGGVSIGTTTNPGAGALIVNSTIQGTQLRGGYNNTTGVANTAAQALGTNTASMVLISADTTLTTTVPPAGAFASVIIKTSGSSSRTVTFGTGFKSQGTLATGATTDRYWVVNFVSDGTSLYETSRTTTAYA